MYQKILVPLDGSELAECVLPHLESIAKGCKTKNIIFLRVVEPLPLSRMYGEYAFTPADAERLDTEHVNAAKEYLTNVISRFEFKGANIKSEVFIGKAADIIADYATENDADLITIATHGRSGVSRWLWGSVADRVLRSSYVSTLMIRAPGYMSGI